jgi:NAD(P)-dependent dehydrogenase (short-subunit alcohol dehydrogenase family)
MITNDGAAPVMIITGGSGGIGGALARRLRAQDCRVVLAARDGDRLRSQAGEIGADAVPTDVTSSAQVDALVAWVLERHGRIDGVAHCVGSIVLKPLHLTSDDDWARTLQLNLTSAFHVVRAVVARHRAALSIALVSSSAAAVGLPNHEAIAASKAGLEGLVRAAAATYASRGVRVNAVAPGLVRTPLAARITGSEAALKSSLALHPLGRIGEPDDVAAMLEFLLHPAHSWITGQVIGADGGMSRLRAL